jgi:outer membrane receptor protein involved in Fe transport
MARRLSLCVLAVLSICFLFNAHVAYGQSAVYGDIIGTVTDAQGAGVAGAKVTVTSVTKGLSQEATSNESGNYTVTHLIPDTYSVTVEAAGFKKYDVANVEVSADTTVKVDAQMQVGAVNQTVEVTTEIPQLKTESKDVSIEFNEKYVEDLPILNRNFTNFELLSPGTQKITGWSHAATENPQGAQQIFVNGQHFSGTAFQLDGTDNQDPIVVNPNLDAIQESKISLQSYDAEVGKAVAGIITVQTKSGTNEFHGAGFYNYRGSGQDARDPFTQTAAGGIPSGNHKEFGFSAGGPIIKDKLFIFGDYQGVREVSGVTNQLTIPTAEVESTCNPATNAASDTPGFCNLGEYLTANISGGGQVYNPTTGSPVDGSGRTAYNNNLIPIDQISPQAAAILALFPKPQNAGVINNYDASGSGSFSQNAFDTRVDYAAPRGFQVFGRFSLDYFSLAGGPSIAGLGGPGFGPGGLNGASRVHNYSLATGFDKAIGTDLLTDLRFGYFKYNPQTHYSDAGTAGATGFGIPCLNSGTAADCGINIPGGATTGGLPSFFLDGNGGFSAFGDGLNVGRCNCPLTESEQQFQVVNNWTKIKGNHTFKFGEDIRYAENLRVPSDANRTGQLHFDAGGTSNGGQGGISLATFLLGDVTQFERFVSTSLNAAERQKRLFFYGQDTWRVTPKFTFNYGLRWEIYFPESVNGKGQGGFANLNDGEILVAGYGDVGTNGNVANTYKAFAPRFGIAYQYDPKTVVRVGYGRSFDIGVFGSNFGHVVTQNLPVLAQQQVFDSTLNSSYTNNRTPVFTLAEGPAAAPSPFPSSIPSDGMLPLLGPEGNSSSRIRPTIQRLPTIDAWSATLQRQVTSSINFEISYIGNKGTHVFAGTGPSYNPNEPAVGGGTDLYTCNEILAAGLPTGTSNCSSSFTPFISQADRRHFFLNGVPAFTYPGYTVNGAPLTCCAVDLTYFGNDASNHYNAIQTKLEKRFTNGLQLLAHYTFSHATAYDSTYYSVDPRVAYGPDPFARNNAFVMVAVYELPVGRGKKFLGDANRAVDLLIGGWQISNTTNWSGGLPWTPTIGECGQIADAGPCRPNYNPGVGGFDLGPHKIDGSWYEFTPVASFAPPSYSAIPDAQAATIAGTDACGFVRPTGGPFSLPSCGTIGNVGFDSFRGPRVFFDDMSLSKKFTITERIHAEFRFDAFNVFNHVVYGFNSTQGNTCIDCAASGGAGQITDIEHDASPGSPNGMRQLQFGVRATF